MESIGNGTKGNVVLGGWWTEGIAQGCGEGCGVGCGEVCDEGCGEVCGEVWRGV